LKALPVLGFVIYYFGLHLVINKKAREKEGKEKRAENVLTEYEVNLKII